MLFSNANNDPSAELGSKELQKLRRQDLLDGNERRGAEFYG